MCVSATGGLRDQRGWVTKKVRYSNMCPKKQEGGGVMMRLPVGKCQICSKVDVLRHQCTKCRKRACGDDRCRVLILETKICRGSIL